MEKLKEGRGRNAKRVRSGANILVGRSGGMRRQGRALGHAWLRSLVLSTLPSDSIQSQVYL